MNCLQTRVSLMLNLIKYLTYTLLQCFHLRAKENNNHTQQT